MVYVLVWGLFWVAVGAGCGYGFLAGVGRWPIDARATLFVCSVIVSGLTWSTEKLMGSGHGGPGLGWITTFPLGALGAGLIVGASLRRPKAEARGACLSCGYNLTGNVSGVCPECGTDIQHRGSST